MSPRYRNGLNEIDMIIYNVNVTKNEIMIATTLALLGSLALSQSQVGDVVDFEQTKNQVVGYLITGLLGVLGVIIWKWIDAVNENTKAMRDIIASNATRDEKIKTHDEKITQIATDVHEIRREMRDELKVVKTELKSEIRQTVNDVIEKKLGKE
jgi:hypothetical protein